MFPVSHRRCTLCGVQNDSVTLQKLKVSHRLYLLARFEAWAAQGTLLGIVFDTLELF